MTWHRKAKSAARYIGAVAIAWAVTVALLLVALSPWMVMAMIAWMATQGR